MRPQGGNGNLRNIFAGTGLNDFWVEYGSKNAIWVTPEIKGWDFSFASLNPFESLASPIPADPFNGVIFSDWTDGVVTSSDALLPFRGVSTPYCTGFCETLSWHPAGSVRGVRSDLVRQPAVQPARKRANLESGSSRSPPSAASMAAMKSHIGSQVLASGTVILDGFNPVSMATMAIGTRR